MPGKTLAITHSAQVKAGRITSSTVVKVVRVGSRIG